MFYPLAFSYSGNTVELKFQQQALRYSLELSRSLVEVAADATTASVDVVSNGDWTVITPEGVTATPASGNGSATVNFTFPANTIGNGNDGCGFVLEFIIDQAAAEKVVVLEDGKYWIVANNKVAKPLSGNYGYINVEDAWVSASSLASVEENAFTFKAVDGGYTIQDESGKYYYQTGTYNSFNVNASTQSDGSHIWTIEKVDGTYKITNNVVSKYVQFSTSYGNFGSYSTESGDLPILVKVENAVPAVNVEEALTFEAEGGTQVIELPAGVTATATSDNPAFTVSVQASAVTVTAGATTDAQSGNLTLVFSYNGFSLAKTVALSQKAAPAAGEKVVFEESFAKSTGTMGWDGTNGNGTFASDNTGWTVENAYGAGGSAKFGTSSKKGKATTPALSFAGTATLTFKAGAWNNGSEVTTLKLSMTGGTLSVTSVTLKKGEWTEYEVTITGATEGAKITFEANVASKNRFFLDDVKIVQNN